MNLSVLIFIIFALFVRDTLAGNCSSHKRKKAAHQKQPPATSANDIISTASSDVISPPPAPATQPENSCSSSTDQRLARLEQMLEQFMSMQNVPMLEAFEKQQQQHQHQQVHPSIDKEYPQRMEVLPELANAPISTNLNSNGDAIPEGSNVQNACPPNSDQRLVRLEQMLEHFLRIENVPMLDGRLDALESRVSAWVLAFGKCQSPSADDDDQQQQQQRAGGDQKS
uniref:Uncharacterized protein n=1 Tax=Globodera rostochiensis TaxID=31243 RepID=A0A914HJR8_GLORO